MSMTHHRHDTKPAGLSKEQYDQMVADCDGLCVITDDMLVDDPNLMKCVRCPFCTSTVDAILTSTQIICPACKSTAER